MGCSLYRFNLVFYSYIFISFEPYYIAWVTYFVCSLLIINGIFNIL